MWLTSNAGSFCIWVKFLAVLILLLFSFCVFSYFTNTLILPVVNGPTEGLALIYVMHFLTGFLGMFRHLTFYSCFQQYVLKNFVLLNCHASTF